MRLNDFFSFYFAGVPVKRHPAKRFKACFRCISGDILAIDINKSLKVAMVPTLVLIAMGVFSSVVGLIPVLNFIVCVLGLPLIIVGWLVLAWAGFKAVKEAKMDLLGGAVTGALAGAISSFINALISFLLDMLGIGVAAAAGGGMLGEVAGSISFGAGVAGLFIAPVVGAIIGLVCGAIGAFAAANLKK